MNFNNRPEASPQNTQKAEDGHAQGIKERLQELMMHMPAAGYIRQAGLIPHIVPFSSATLWRMVNAGTFPAPYKLSARITAWRTGEVMAWAEKKPKIRVHKRKAND
ncbi:AlpA family phage regulatory protein [Rhodoferax sp. GW822-FHT02A01]|uniref:helix-turn-helix transcriptional regulator n=1 Tax=Rhodoferax sp. GW822-FHT02A01 TaxID=3141537 RepID=UPI00315D3F24